MFYGPGIYFFFFNDTATTEIYTLSLHDALPIWIVLAARSAHHPRRPSGLRQPGGHLHSADRKSTRLNSSHVRISYAVFCLKKKKTRTAIGITANQAEFKQGADQERTGLQQGITG